MEKRSVFAEAAALQRRLQQVCLAMLLGGCLLVVAGCQGGGGANRYEGMTDQERDYARNQLESLDHDMTRREVISRLGIPRHEYVRESGAMLEWYGPDQNPSSRIAVYFDNQSQPTQVRWSARNRFVWQHDLLESEEEAKAGEDSQVPMAP